jgi:hypothetical protein
MLKAIAFGLAAGAAVQGFRSWPATAPMTADGVALIFVIGVVCAYLGGRWHGRGGGAHATAVAVARAEATAVSAPVQTVNLIVGQRPVSAVRVPDADVEWFGEVRPAITAADLDGMDLSEFAEMRDEQPAD